MKTLSLFYQTRFTPLCILMAGVLVAGPAPGEPERRRSRAPMRDAPRHEDLTERHVKRENPMDQLAATTCPSAESEPWKPVGLLERSEFLSFRGLITLVPKGAVLHVPESYRSRVGKAPGGKIVTWPEFLRLNRGWIGTLEVSRQQAEAEQPLSEETIEALNENPRLVVATLSGGPITVIKTPSKPVVPEIPADTEVAPQPVDAGAPNSTASVK